MKKIYHIQPALPNYRLDYFDRIYSSSEGSVIYPLKSDLNFHIQDKKKWNMPYGKEISLPLGFKWYSGVFVPKYDKDTVIILTGNVRYLSNYFAIFFARLKSAKVIWWGHYRSASSNKYSTFIRMLIAKSCSAILFYTEGEKRQFEKSFLCRKEKTFFTNNGLNIDLISQYRINYSPKRKPSIIFIGRINNKSNIELLIYAMKILQDKSFSLHIIGSGKNISKVKGLINKLELSDKVFLHGSLYEEKEIASIINKCRIFVYPGHVGLSLIHAMSYGLPSIIYKDRNFHMPEADAFYENITGISFDSINPDSLARAINSLMSNHESLKEMSDKSLTEIHEIFNTSKMYSNFNNMIKLLEK